MSPQGPGGAIHPDHAPDAGRAGTSSAHTVSAISAAIPDPVVMTASVTGHAPASVRSASPHRRHDGQQEWGSSDDDSA
jgi:hypothetical protein